ncbi:putative EGF-like domain-containing protein [Plasmopara halstedii]
MHFFRFLLLVFICSRGTLFLNAFSCDGGCSEHGICEHSTGRCICFPDFTGATCASRLCPMGAAWVDRAWTIDKAHQPAECSAMGRCDRLTGICICESGFEGLACERLACPNSCSGNGRCVSIRDAAELYDDRNFFVRTTYTLWDADKIMGCQCDPGYIGFDCSERECPKGDNPFTTTTQDHAIQELTCICNSCSGTFTLSFQSQVTTNIAATATSSDLKMALETLDNIYGLDIVSATPLCSNSGTTTSITFTHNPGDVPLLQVKSTLNSGTITLITSQVGTRENAYCSNRGICDFATGVCKCIAGFTSGNGGLPPLPGRRGDCGYPLGAPICPTTSNGVCDNKGTCSSGTSYECICLSGFTGYDCSLRECPKGAAWFDGATAPDTAHALSFCSNKGRCDTTTGRCVCVAPFTGAACDLIQCPSGTSLNSGGSCSGRGTCKNIQQLSLEAKDHAGNLLGVTYGAIPNTLATWDATKIQGCDCDLNDYFGPYELAYGDLMGGHDCNVRTCPRGADPFESGKVNEKQTINCIADGGYFTLTFRQETTLVIPFDANVARVQATFETLQSVRGAIVTFDTGTVACSATGVVITIEFTFMQGDLPLLNIDTSGLTLSGNPTTLTVAELVKGTKANIECSARGICDRGTGICACFPYFLSSNGAGGPGRRGDCGFISPYPSTTIS